MSAARDYTAARVVNDSWREILIASMAETFLALGYHKVRARVEPYAVPEVLRGTVSSIRPDVVAQYKNRKLALCECVSPDEIDADNTERWSLILSAPRALGGAAEVHFAVNEILLKRRAGPEHVAEVLARKLACIDNTPYKLWRI